MIVYGHRGHLACSVHLEGTTRDQQHPPPPELGELANAHLTIVNNVRLRVW